MQPDVLKNRIAAGRGYVCADLVLKNARVKNENKGKFREDPEVEAAIAAAEKDLEGEGRVLIRPSGTEPLVRVMLEGQDVEKITGIAEKIAVLLTKKFG